jgi:hypothetical protein
LIERCSWGRMGPGGERWGGRASKRDMDTSWK